jgi:hypothetical protein
MSPRHHAPSLLPAPSLLGKPATIGEFACQVPFRHSNQQAQVAKP